MMGRGTKATLVALVIMALAAAPRSGFARASDAAGAYPADIDPQSGNRLPLPKREELDAAGQKTYDQLNSPGGGSLAGLRGPGGILLHSPKLSELNGALNRFLRGPDTGWSPRVRELAILVAAREFNSQFEWAAHEKVALSEGVPPQSIAAVKYRRSVRGLPETDAVVIELGREVLRAKKVGAATYARALKQFGPEGLINLVALMGNYTATAAVLATFDMRLPPGQKPLLPMP